MIGIFGGFALGVLELLAAWWILGRMSAYHVEKQRRKAVKEEQKYLESRVKEARKLSQDVQKALAKKTKTPLPKLDQLVLQDAINREARATAALIAVMQEAGCTEEQIEDVVNKVQGEPQEK